MYEKLNLPFNIPFSCNIHNSCCEYYPQDDGAMLVEWWNETLWWVFYYLHNTIGF